jgi:predicted ArsR family transcriptional regulator
MPPKVATRSSLEQVARLDTILRQPYGASIGEMAKSLDCHAKTVRRHLNWMQRKLGCRLVVIVKEGRPCAYRYRDGTDAIFNRDVTRWMQ